MSCNPRRVLFLVAFSLFFASLTATAHEGMWLPPQIAAHAADMKAMGLEIPIDMLYNDQGTGLNNAVVLFGKGCTGELISGEGLVLTNHHCGYGSVQALSNGTHDYFANGFWAMNRGEEVACGGLTVTFIRKMENISDRILTDIPDTLAGDMRDTVIARRIRAALNGYNYVYGPKHMNAEIRPFYNGNQYWVIISQIYEDIRLVGFPPNGIGAFGGDTDNWMWPRHGGDFSLFRIYAGTDNQPAKYSKDNKPYVPQRFFPISTKGYKEGDFTMVYGFPGTTQEYISSGQLRQVSDITDPIRVALRTTRLDIWTKHMSANREVFLKYTSKRAGVANGWKKWQGEMRGLDINHVAEQKEDKERQFDVWARTDTTLPFADNLTAQMLASTTNADSALKLETYLLEGPLSIELVAQGVQLEILRRTMLRNANNPEALHAALSAAKPGWDAFYRNYDTATDKEVFLNLMPQFMENNPDGVPELFRERLAAAGGDYSLWADKLYKTALIANGDRMYQILESGTIADTATIMNAPGWQLYEAIQEVRMAKTYPVLAPYYDRIDYLNRLYLKAQMQEYGAQNFYSDANLTLRLAYGKVHGIDPEGPTGYAFQTNIDEIMAKDNPAVEEFKVPERLKDLFYAKDYGRWKTGHTVPVAFLADNHTTGGNSGSPVLNGKGELIGTNFDRIWEGTMSDYYFDPKLCRNISVDVRYTLFIIEKFGKAGWLLKEMKLVQ